MITTQNAALPTECLLWFKLEISPLVLHYSVSIVISSTVQWQSDSHVFEVWFDSIYLKSSSKLYKIGHKRSIFYSENCKSIFEKLGFFLYGVQVVGSWFSFVENVLKICFLHWWVLSPLPATQWLVLGLAAYIKLLRALRCCRCWAV